MVLGPGSSKEETDPGSPRPESKTCASRPNITHYRVDGMTDLFPGRRLAVAGKIANPVPTVQRHSEPDPQSGAITPEQATVNPGPFDMAVAITNTPGPYSFSSSSFSSSSSTGLETNVLLPSPPSMPPLPCDQRLLIDPKMRAMIALWLNGTILGLACDKTNWVMSPPRPASVPQTLHSTDLQLSTFHYDWIDRLPFPRMRDNLILLSMTNVADVDDLFKDFFYLPSFAVREGADSWDPRAWEVLPEFEAKWGYLLH